jgi:hypothetical protein
VPRPTQVPTGSQIHVAYRAFTSYGRPSQCRSAMNLVCNSTIAGPTTPHASIRFRLLPVRSPLLRQSLLISVPPGTEMVQFPGYSSVHLLIQCTVTGLSPSRVTPFGNSRIAGCLLLPVTFRSLPRPSSPDSSEASSMDPSSLDHILSLPLISKVTALPCSHLSGVFQSTPLRANSHHGCGPPLQTVSSSRRR